MAPVSSTSQSGKGRSADVSGSFGFIAILRVTVGLAHYLVRSPFLLLALVLLQLGTVLLLWPLFVHYPWIPVFLGSWACLCVHALLVLQRAGVMAVLPYHAVNILNRPLFDLLNTVFVAGAMRICNAIRVGMLVCCELADESRKEIIEGLDSELCKDIFHRPVWQLLPIPGQRLLLGQQLHMPASRPWEPSAEPTPESPVVKKSESATFDIVVRRPSQLLRQPSLVRRRTNTADDVLRILRDVEGAARRSHAFSAISMLQKTVTEKVADTALMTVWQGGVFTVSSAGDYAAEKLEHGKEKAHELVEGCKAVVKDPTAQVTAVTALGGAAAVGTGTGALGFACGGIMGAAVGVVPALFTFGLSIPIGAAIGSGMGLCLGATTGGAVGGLGGGATGYYAMRRCQQQQSVADVDEPMSKQASIRSLASEVAQPEPERRMSGEAKDLRRALSMKQPERRMSEASDVRRAFSMRCVS
eukprot:TRINITY_DN45657_c0_g1_i1.p1 TRINITY_DN45657_c0_g1~~TRINITY_DN45657_c0_g1_i1.p1  ORF type:complete len:472 (+),score=89.73 TRINITY_DN45657_c0_g1_i1:122-1537(+)